MVDKFYLSFDASMTGLSGYCYLNKGECNLNQSKDDSFVERVAKNNTKTMATATKFMRFS